MKEKYNRELLKLQAELCKTFAEPSRLIIIQELRDGEKNVSDLQTIIGISQPHVSHHLSILKAHGVVQTRRAGKSTYYSLTNPKICEACDIVHEILVHQMKTSHELTKKLVG
jgi:ArsR family transcriptional regulator